MKQIVIVVGLGSQGLAVCRLMGASGWTVYALGTRKVANRKEYTYSKYIKGRYYEFETEKEFFYIIDKIQRNHPNCLLKIILTSAVWLAILREKHPELWLKYDVSSGPIETLNLLADKSKMYKRCREIGLNTVKDVLYSNYVEGCIQFPIVIKHNIESVYLEEKCIKVNNDKELKEEITKIPNELIPHLILQEYIGEDFREIDFRGYIQDGKIIGSSIIESIRSKPIGITSYLEEITDDKIINRVTSDVRMLLSETNYTGFIGADMKYRDSDGTCYILDVNPRTPSSISAWMIKYSRKNLIDFFSPEPKTTSLKVKRNGIRWVNIYRDLHARIESGDWKSLLKSLTARYDVWDSHDPMPFLMMCILSVKRKIKRQGDEGFRND